MKRRLHRSVELSRCYHPCVQIIFYLSFDIYHSPFSFAICGSPLSLGRGMTNGKWKLINGKCLHGSVYAETQFHTPRTSGPQIYL